MTDMCRVATASIDVGEEKLAAMAAALPAWRREQCARKRRAQDRASCVVSYHLLGRLWEEEQPGALPTVRATETGQLVFTDACGWHLSLSHRDGWAAAALAPAPVGVDITGPVRPELLRRIGSLAEQQRYADADDLAPLWTRKEALAKRAGTGLTRALAQIDTADPCLHTWLREDPPLTLSVACDSPVQPLTGWTPLP